MNLVVCKEIVNSTQRIRFNWMSYTIDYRVKAQYPDMKHYILFAVILTAFSLLIESCNDSLVEPGPTTYPLELTVISENSTAELHWTELTVSTFEEYIIVRSEDSIPDSPEPELVGNAIIVERIDKATTTEFVDFATPISQSVYYKVFGKIGDHYLPTPTVRIDLSIQIIDLRADVSEIDLKKKEIVAYDRATQILFVYNYASAKIRVQKFIPFSNPIIRLGAYNSVDEIYITDQNGVMYIYNPSNLHLIRQSSSFPQPINFIYDEGRFIIARLHGAIAIMDRATLQIQDVEGDIINQRSLYKGKRNGEELEILEIGFSQMNKYILENNDLRRVDSNADFPGGFQLITAEHPDGNQFVINGSGRIIDNDLNFLGSLEGGGQFYNQIQYTEDGSKLFAVGFHINEFKLKFFDVKNQYAKLSENKVSFSPVKMYSDDTNVYLMTVIFLNGGVRTLISNYKIP